MKTRFARNDGHDLPAMMSLAEPSPTTAQWSASAYEQLFSMEKTDGARRRALLIEDEHPEDENSPATKIIGFLIWREVSGEWEIENVVVATTHQRRGYGRQLLTEAISLAGGQGAQRMFLEVRDSNSAACALYRKLGFRQTGKRKGYYMNPNEDAALFELSLRVDQARH